MAKKRKKITKLSLPKNGRKSKITRSKGTAPAPKRHSGRSSTGYVKGTKNPKYGGGRLGSGGNLASQRKKR